MRSLGRRLSTASSSLFVRNFKMNPRSLVVPSSSKKSTVSLNLIWSSFFIVASKSSKVVTPVYCRDRDVQSPPFSNRTSPTKQMKRPTHPRPVPRLLRMRFICTPLVWRCDHLWILFISPSVFAVPNFRRGLTDNCHEPCLFFF